MAEKELTLRMDSREYQALRLHAVRQGMTVETLVLDLVRADVAKSAPADPTEVARRRQELVAAILQRAGVDPGSPEYQAIVTKADRTIRHDGTAGHREQGGRRGAA